MNPEDNLQEQQMDPTSLYREDIFTDRRVGTIRQLTPVTSNGAADSTRAVLYAGQAQILTAVGAVPLNFDIAAASLAEAIENFSPAAKVALDKTLDEIKEMQREAASSIIVPEAGSSGLGGAGGMPGGGRIKMR